MLVTRGRLQTDDEQLTDRCRHWIDGVKGQFAGTPVGPGTRGHRPAALKSGFKAA